MLGHRGGGGGGGGGAFGLAGFYFVWFGGLMVLDWVRRFVVLEYWGFV